VYHLNNEKSITNLIFGTAPAVVSVTIERNNKESCAIGYTGRNEANMIIEKSKKTYTVTEHRDKWPVSAESGKLSVAFDVSKEQCPTADALRVYVNNSSIF
jgi:hypothetical protein